ncbi:hypothetical protein, partial [Escherichia coli]|uniref:hypothetical protein n=1 Tax=Escherichia coli TaxID=562 RepID=UPI001302AC4F
GIIERDANQHDNIRAVGDMIAAFSDPGQVNPAYADHVLAQATTLLETVDAPAGSADHPRMPTSMIPRAADLDEPDQTAPLALP